MKKITTDETLRAGVQELYEKTREAMEERPGQWRDLEITFAHVCKICKRLGLEANPLPIPKSNIIHSAPPRAAVIEQASELPTPPPPAGDVLAHNAPKRGRKRKSE